MLRRTLNGTGRMITLAEISKRLDVTPIAVRNWRRGSSQRRPLPQRHERAGSALRVKIDETDFTNWLREYRPDLLQRWEQWKPGPSWPT
jgi:hypothetical protein